MRFALSTSSRTNRLGIHDDLIKISDLAIQITTIDFGHGSSAGLRTAEQQHALYLAGNSKADGYKRLSNHQSGNALDFYAYINGRASWEREHLAMVAAAHLQAASILGIKLSWGGLWRSKKGFYGWDMPHVELTD